MMSKSTKQNLLLALLLTIIVLCGVYLYQVRQYNKALLVNSFATCAEAGYPVMESYPARCITPDGRSFTQTVVGQEITVTGQITCLPHKDMSGPITLECAFGMRDGQGNHYALNDPNMQTTPFLSTEDPITVTGTLAPDPDSKYDIEGVITVESVTQ